MSAMRRIAFALLAGSLLFGSSAPARAEDRLPGEATELTDKVKAEAQQHVAAITKGGEGAVKARRALLVLGPVVWPVLDNALRLTVMPEPKPHLLYLKALLAPKAEPEFEYLRGRLRRKILMDDLNGVLRELNDFRQGRPDPKQKNVKIPPTPTSKEGKTTLFRSGDASIVIVFGGDGTSKEPDAPAVSVTEANAGFVAAVGGKAMPFARRSGKGSDVSVRATNGFAWAWATDGGAGLAPGGQAGDGGSAQAEGGAGNFGRSGSGGAGAPADGK